MTTKLKLNRVELSPTQQRLWDETRCALLWHCPAFTHLLYTMLDNAGSKHIAIFTDDEAIKVAATDGSNLILNPDGFFKYDLNERVFICAHEIMHCVFDHCGQMHHFKTSNKVPYNDGTTLPFDHATMNKATDLVINDALIESKVGLFNKDWLHDQNIATAKDSAIDAYRKLYKQNNKSSGGQAGFDEHLEPGTSQGKDPTTASSQRSQSQWDQAVAAAAASAKAMGKLPAGLERLLNEVLNPQVDWREKIRGLMARRLGSDRYEWRKPDRRLITRDIYAPSKAGYGAGTVVVGCDTSGSIGEKELNMFFAEMAGILEDVRPRELVIIWCDAAVGRVDHCEEAGDLNEVRYKGAPGGGGTSFIPVFDEIENLGLEPDALVYLTDGMGSFPAKAPSYPVIWGNIYPASKYPFGDVVDVPVQA